MRLAIVSHKPIYESCDLPGVYKTDGGFPLQIRAISELFSQTKVVVPCKPGNGDVKGLSVIAGNNLTVIPLSSSKATGIWRKLTFPLWLIVNGRIIWREIKGSDAVHAPIPGDVGTIGIYIALLMRKPLFVRHCGNWLVQRTIAERFWKWTMESFAGGENVMFATGGTEEPPSQGNSKIKWIFSTSLTNSDLARAAPRAFPSDGKLRLITVCRLEPRKGVDLVIESMPRILEKFPEAKLEIVGDGSLAKRLSEKAEQLQLTRAVFFRGKVPQSEVLALMKNAHVFCFPTSASEGFPKVVLEALASGLPVITTNVSVLPQLVGNGSGLLLDQPSGKNIAKAVTEIIKNEDVYAGYSTNAISTARQYSLESWRDFIGKHLRSAWNVSSLASPES